MEVECMRDKASKEHNYMNKQQPILQETTHNISPPPPTTTTSPPSTSSTSPTHEFSFTISLNPNPPPKSTQDSHNNNHHHNHSLTPPQEPLTAVDLSPADDIFFHGHLLPLHLLSTLPISPRSSKNSIDNFTLPMKEIVKDQQNPTGNTSFHHRNTFSDLNKPTNNIIQTKPKSKSFSIFSIPMLKKGSLDEQGVNNNNNPNKKLKLEVVQLIKKYMNMVKPFMLFSKTKRANNIQCNRKPHSFSSNFLSSSSSLPVGMSRGGVRRGKFSAPASIRTSPASIRTSPANSGILRASGTLSPAKSTASDSTMEELQAAIQAAIAHCKNSIAIEDKV